MTHKSVERDNSSDLSVEFLGILAACVRRQVFHERLSEYEELLNMQAVGV